mmetsp:Transcript_18605/g.55590  ORF Transcript_18605/g.55590 Transcript_18605/m.55590 type:complete len:272 (+) Transcript_18605:391-1206(+)
MDDGRSWHAHVPSSSTLYAFTFSMPNMPKQSLKYQSSCPCSAGSPTSHSLWLALKVIIARFDSTSMGPCMPTWQLFRKMPLSGSSWPRGPSFVKSSAFKRTGMKTVSGSSLTVQSYLKTRSFAMTSFQNLRNTAVLSTVWYFPPTTPVRAPWRTLVSTRGSSPSGDRRIVLLLYTSNASQPNMPSLPFAYCMRKSPTSYPSGIITAMQKSVGCFSSNARIALASSGVGFVGFSKLFRLWKKSQQHLNATLSFSSSHVHSFMLSQPSQRKTK